MSLSTTSPDNRRPDFLKLFTPVMTPQLVLFPSGKIFKYVILPHSTHITVSECQNVISSPDNRRPECLNVCKTSLENIQICDPSSSMTSLDNGRPELMS